jgi:hypothetical protein
MQVIVAPESLDVQIQGKVVVVKVKEDSTLEIFLGREDQKEVEKILNALFEIKAKELGLE